MAHSRDLWTRTIAVVMEAVDAGDETSAIAREMAVAAKLDVPEGTDPSQSVDLAFRIMERVVPGWIVEHMADDASGTVGSMRPLGATCELSDGSREVQGMAPTRALAILVAVSRAKLAAPAPTAARFGTFA